MLILSEFGPVGAETETGKCAFNPEVGSAAAHPESECSMGDGALVTGSGWLWVLDRRG